MRKSIFVSVFALVFSVLQSGCAAVGAAAGYALTENASPGVQLFGTVAGAYIGGAIDAAQANAQYEHEMLERQRRDAAGSTDCRWQTSGTTDDSGDDQSDGGNWECEGSNSREGRHGTPPRMSYPR